MRLIVLLMAAAACFAAETSLWKATCGTQTLYVGGTVHMLRPGDYPLPKAFQTAFDASDVLVLETDILAADDPGFMQAMFGRLIYADGRTLRDDLSPKTYRKLQQYLVSRGLPPNGMDMLKPPMVMISLVFAELPRLGITEPGVDRHFALKAARSKMRTGALETPQEQIAFLEALGKGMEDRMIEEAIEQAENVETVFAQMIAAWRAGDLEAIERLGAEEFKDAEPLFETLIVERNRNWMRTLEPMMRSKEVELVLVGALHLPGKRGVLALLSQRGCRLQSVR